jgi:hypothetical protein
VGYLTSWQRDLSLYNTAENVREKVKEKCFYIDWSKQRELMCERLMMMMMMMMMMM